MSVVEVTLVPGLGPRLRPAASGERHKYERELFNGPVSASPRTVNAPNEH